MKATFINFCVHSDLAGLRRSFAAIMVFAFCLTQLSGCGISKPVPAHKYDGPPPIEPDVTKIRNAVPKVEPHHPYGKRDYKLNGRRYKVLKSAKGYSKKGYASWYGSNFHGKETSTQERFNMYGMTAASTHLPLPTYVEVTNLRNKKKIIVKVNDRGPFVKGRLIDLSYAAAKKLGFAKEGVAPVRVVAIDPKEWARKNSKPKPMLASNTSSSNSSKLKEKPNSSQMASDKATIQSKKFLQLGAFSQFDNAQKLSDKANKVLKNPTHIEHQSGVYRVKIGPLASTNETDDLKELLEQNGFDKIDLIEA